MVQRAVTSIDFRSDKASLGPVFRAFDQLRKHLAVEMHGDAGAFTGFTYLNVQPDLLLDPKLPKQISATAVVTGASRRSTKVEYEASYRRLTPRGVQTRIIAKGVGVTVHPSKRHGALVAHDGLRRAI